MYATSKNPRSLTGSSKADALTLTRTSIFTCVVEFGSIGEPLISSGEVEFRLRSLGNRFTRFDSGSELCRFNSSAGEWVDVSRDMHQLLRHSLIAAVESRGLVNIAVLTPLIAAGYGQSWPFQSESADEAEQRVFSAQSPIPALTEILELQDSRARIMPGFAVDFGGIAKGVWADMVTELLGPNSICNLGGDIACRGTGPSGDGWPVCLPNDDLVRITNGGIATSGIDKRYWGQTAHHIIDPRTGLPCVSDVRLATAVAGNCTTAEWVAKSVVIGGSSTASDLRDHPHVSAIFES